MDQNQDPSSTVASNRHPALFILAVVLVEGRNGQRIQKEFGGLLKADPVLTQVFPRLTRHSKLYRADLPPMDGELLLVTQDVGWVQPAGAGGLADRPHVAAPP
ncbi:MAG: hypothetical protein WD733_21425, partial [Bryobacterales bacterium]